MLISDNAITILAAETVLGIFLPVVLLVLWQKRTHAKVFSAVMGVITFLAFEQVLAPFFSQAMFTAFPNLKLFLNENQILSAIYTGAVFALFAESGCYATLKFTLLDRCPGKDNAAFYSVGYGAAQWVFAMGMTAAFYLLTALSVNSGVPFEMLAESFGGTEALETAVTAISAIDAKTLAVAIFERASMFALRILLSLLLLVSATEEKPYLLAAAIAIHAVIRAITMLIPSANSALLYEALLLSVLCAAIFAGNKKFFAKTA